MKKLQTLTIIALCATIVGTTFSVSYYLGVLPKIGGPAQTTVVSVMTSTTVSTNILTTGQASSETAMANLELTVSVNSPGAWFLVSGVGQEAMIPRNQSVQFDLLLNNTGNSAIDIRGIQVSFGYPNGSVPNSFMPIYQEVSLSPKQHIVVPFVYGTDLPRFPGYCCGKIIFTVFGEWGVTTKTVLLFFA